MARAGSRCGWWFAVAGALLAAGTVPAAGTPSAAVAAGALSEVDASPPSGWSVTVYRAAARDGGSLQLDRLGGFALISETRSISLPAGDVRVRFPGVADGIEAVSVILTGLPGGVVEKNLDAAVLSPAAVVAAAVGQDVELVRTDPKTGRSTRSSGKVLSDAEGVLFQTEEGIEALRCSGLPERFGFSGTGGLASTPTLSTVVHSAEPTAAIVTLSYLARGFDWTADYVATLAPGGERMDLGAWVTLANGNAAGFADASTQVVAGRVNHVTGRVEPVSAGGAILARCWPRGRTSDVDWTSVWLLQRRDVDRDRMFKKSVLALAGAPAPLLQDIAVTGMRRVEQEQLGDLKLYRVPEPTTVASRQIKQVRLLDKADIPIQLYYEAELAAIQNQPAFPATRKLRTKNDGAHHLDLPLPSGRVSSFEVRGGERLLLAEAPLRDVAVGEKVELALGASPDVQVSQRHESHTIAGGEEDLGSVDVSNARAAAVEFELRLSLQDGASLVWADHVIESRDGRPLFRFKVPAGATVTVHYRSRQARPPPARR